MYFGLLGSQKCKVMQQRNVYGNMVYCNIFTLSGSQVVMYHNATYRRGLLGSQKCEGEQSGQNPSFISNTLNWDWMETI